MLDCFQLLNKRTTPIKTIEVNLRETDGCKKQMNERDFFTQKKFYRTKTARVVKQLLQSLLFKN